MTKVYVEGQLGELDEPKLDKLAEKLKGECVSSGCMIDTRDRDIQYEFYGVVAANEFASQAKKVTGVRISRVEE